MQINKKDIHNKEKPESEILKEKIRILEAMVSENIKAKSKKTDLEIEFLSRRE